MLGKKFFIGQASVEPASRARVLQSSLQVLGRSDGSTRLGQESQQAFVKLASIALNNQGCH